jgi:sec-independent protein translocase protein TatB
MAYISISTSSRHGALRKPSFFSFSQPLRLAQGTFMFGIGLPEMILILALALIVVGPDKLPDLARSVAKGVMELKKTAEALKKNLSEEGNPLNDIKADLDESTRALGHNLLESDDSSWKTRKPREGVNPAPDSTGSGITDAEFTVTDAVASDPNKTEVPGEISDTAATTGPKKDTASPPPC